MRTTLRPGSSELSIEGVGQRMQQVVQEGGGEEYAQKGQHQPGERHQLGHVGVVEHLPAAGPDLLVDGDNDVATIERQHGEEVEDAEEQVDRDEEDQRVP